MYYRKKPKKQIHENRTTRTKNTPYITRQKELKQEKMTKTKSPKTKGDTQQCTVYHKLKVTAHYSD